MKASLDGFICVWYRVYYTFFLPLCNFILQPFWELSSYIWTQWYVCIFVFPVLFERQEGNKTNKELERLCPPACSLHSLQQLRQSQKLNPDLPCGCRDSGSWAITCSLSWFVWTGSWNHNWSQELNLELQLRMWTSQNFVSFLNYLFQEFERILPSAYSSPL